MNIIKKENNLELFSIIWLDSNFNINDNQKIDEKLRLIINNLKKFLDIQQCQQFIEQTSKDDRLIIITNDIQGKQIIPNIHHLQQISLIYIYSIDKSDHQQWTKNFSKVKSVVTEFDQLIVEIEKDQKIRMKIEEPLSIGVFNVNDNEDKSTTDLNGKFIYSQLLVDCIRRIKPNQNDKNELISLYKEEYEGNSIELRNICEFENNYSSKKALWWYTKESFFYKTLNKALRTQNIHMIYLLRSYINDIYYQLEENQSKSQLKVYRFQLISKDELNHLLKNLGQFISINSFFSTSTQRDVATFYMGNEFIQQNHFQRILFEIDALPYLNSKKPFANISSESEFYNEFEVLFTPGSIFHLENIYLSDNQLWIIHLTSCHEDEHHLKLIFDQMKQQNGIGETDLRILAKFLTKMGKFDLAEYYYHRLINQIPSDDPSLITLYEHLDQIASQRGDFDKSLQWQQKLLSLKQQTIITDQKALSTVIKKLKRYPTGDTYDGQFLNDLYHGYGIYTWKNGNRYEGMWEKNRREGQGTWIWGEQSSSPGDRYQGQWHLDQKHGDGEYFQANGDIYTGKFQDDQRHGPGIYRTQNGQSFNVVYHQNELISSEEIKK